MSPRAFPSFPLRSLLAFALAFALALGQHAAAVHELGHATERIPHDGSAPQQQECAEDSLYAPFSGAISGAAPASLAVDATLPAPSARAPQCACLPVRHSFHTRAPPAARAA